MNFTKIIDTVKKAVLGDASNAFDQAAQQARQPEISRRQHFLDRSREVDEFLNEYKTARELKGLVDVEKCHNGKADNLESCLLYTSPSPRDRG